MTRKWETAYTWIFGGAVVIGLAIVTCLAAADLVRRFT